MLLPIVVNSLILAAAAAGQICAHRLIRAWLERTLGRSRARPLLFLLAAIGIAAIAIIVSDNAAGRWLWTLSPPVSRALSLGAAIWITGWGGAALLLWAAGVLGRVRPIATRRDFLGHAARAAALAPFGVAAYGTLILRDRFELREIDFPAAGLPPDLHGLRIALLTDVHFGPYLSRAELDRAVAMANETRPHLALLAGDFITRTGDPLELCLERLARLRADAGIYACLGNHEIHAGCEDLAEARGRQLGIQFLRRRSTLLRFGQANLNLAGVDYQRQRRPYLAGAGELLAPGALNLLLSHNPDVFPVAAGLGYDLVVAGHTHGGQVTVEILEQTVNIARFFTPFVAGLYRRNGSALYVSRGLGTINLPMRLGARPELTLLRLRQA